MDLNSQKTPETHGVTTTIPSYPIQNGYIESFNRKLRDECFNQNLFKNLYEAKEIIEDWRNRYNHFRPHSSLDNLTPEEYTKKISGDLTSYLVNFWGQVTFST